MLATENKYPNPAQVALATGQRGTLEAQTKNPASDQGQTNIGAARRLAGDFDRTRMPLPSAPAASASETLSGYTPTGRAGVYRSGNSFSDLNGVNGAIQMDRGPAGAPALSASEQLMGMPRNAAPATPSAGPNADALARLQANNAAAQPAPAAAPRQFDRAASIRALSDLRSPEAIALRNLRIDAQEEARDSARMGRAGRGNNAAGQAYAALMGELTTGTRQGQTAEMQDAGQTQRTGMQEAGATGRTAMTEGGNMARARMTNDVQMGELGLKRETAAISNSAAQQLAQVQQSYVSARTPQERAQAAQTLRVLTGKDDAPAAPTGYRWTQQGSLQPIAGGPADRSRDPKLTEDQGKAAGYAVRMENSLNLLNEINQTNPGATRPGVGTALLNTLPEGVANMVRTEDRQRVEAAQLDALDAALTLNTGAAYTREQLQGMSRSYFAQPGDSDKTVQEKQARLGSLIETARLRAGPQGNQMADAALARGRQDAQQPAGQPQPAQVPQAGEVRKGYVFKGGDPADRSNWEAVQ